MSRQITSQELIRRLRLLGVDFVTFDIYSGFDKEATYNYSLQKSTPLPAIVDEKLSELEDEQSQLGIAAADLVFSNTKNSERAFIFLPTFPTYKIFNASDYLNRYGSYTRFNADIEYIYNRLRLISLNIFYFTPYTYKYLAKDVFAGYPKNAEKVIVDPLILKNNLGQIKGDKMNINEEKQNRIIEKHVNRIVEAVLKEVENKSSVSYIYLPFYLDRREFKKLNIKNMSVFIYNSAVERACRTLNDLRKSNENYSWYVCGCDPEGPEVTEKSYLFIDVPAVVYGAK